MRQHLATLLPTLLLCCISAVSVRAEVPTPDQAFLDTALPPLNEVTEKILAGAQKTNEAMQGVRQVLAERRRVLDELKKTHRLTDLTGIETQDQYDALVMNSVRRIAALAVSDSIPMDPAIVSAMEDVMAALPSLGKQPIPFMVLGYSELAMTAGDSMMARGVSRELVDRFLLEHISAAAELSVQGGEDFFADSATRSLRQELVLARLRCPDDGSTYKMNAMKNQLHDQGNISMLYYLQCSKCGEPRVIEFPQELASRLNRMAQVQNQAKPAEPPTPHVVSP